MDFSEQFKEYIKRANDALCRFIKPQFFKNTSLIQAMEYGALFGGKRLRPFLVYATGKMFNVDSNTLDTLAAAIECIHAYSLIHDDLPAMDNDNLRRGLPSCHIKFGEANAILAGNALQTLAFSILSDAPMIGVIDRDRIAMISELAMASGAIGMCEGQSLELEIKNKQITIENLEYIHCRKTGALIRAAIRLSAISAGDRGRNNISLLDHYAACIGLAFQVQDDILDVIIDNTTLNQYQIVDQKFNKKTYPALLGIEQAKTKARNLVNDAHQILKQLNTQSLDTSELEAITDYIVQRDK